MNLKKLIVIVGPTAVGKTSVSINLAKHYQSEILSADSRQFFKELEIGTAKPSNEELSAVQHHFINTHSIKQPYDVGEYEKDAIQLLEKKFEKYETLFLVGGSGLYVNAICNGLDKFPAKDEKLRKTLNEQYAEEGLEVLISRLKSVDPEYLKIVDQKNPQRIIRALEVSISTGQPYSSFRSENKIKRPFEIIKIGLKMERELLYKRIDQRMEEMIVNGLFEEARSFSSLQDLNALQTVGYKEIFGHFNGEYDKHEAIRLLKRNSRRYAKRQLTWFKKDTEIKWFDPSQVDEMISYIDNKISESFESKN